MAASFALDIKGSSGSGSSSSGGQGGQGGLSRAGGAAASALRRFGSGQDDRSPILELNTTPLIDVMLVLLVMMIITIPSQTHKVPLALPGIELPSTNPLRNLLTLDRHGVARWNGQAVDDRALTALLRGVAAMERPAEVHFEPDAVARYERVDGVLALASRSGVGTLGFVGNERYQDSF